ncbi:tetratricopeptide repeat protein [Actomonas aquatica]|uniref:Tetratricopeptide repeat protein n=1 Tax=Actomonas aquatica TaxID=2866162 RepID=A0ABZ1CAV1_9BACT|nr:tetratricopeptide repeat protein [Opitutus sp. WL0086]WRQ87435.1 tetratricopeptide repeat protein [Opitutus sp. WL0086]
MWVGLYARLRHLFAAFTFPLAALAENPPTFVADVAPILAANCVECHRADGIGPFPLVTYREARRRARQIAEVTASGYMPPWKPDPNHGPALQGERRLSPAAIATLQAWHEAGAPSGDLDAFTPPPLPTGDWTLGEPDLEVTFDDPFVVPAEGTDIFRNFVIRLPLDERRYIRAVEFLPESALVVHHAIIAFDSTDESRMLDAADPGPGFASMDTGGGVHPNGHIIGWTPGQHPYEVHPGTAFAVEPGTDLVLQLHLLPSGRPEPLAPRIGLHFATEPPTHTGFSLLLREDDIYLPAGSRGIVVAESIILPADAAVLGMYPHAHYLGQDMRITATLPDGEQRWLLHIPDWDFNWQSDYRYEEPLPLPAGTRIDMRYTYDNSAANPRNPHHPPIDVHAGNSSFDEMGSIAIQFLLDSATDLPKFHETQSRYQIASGDTSPDALFNLAVAIDQQGRVADAIAAYQNVLAVAPEHPFALNNLASLRERRGELDAARALYAQVREIDPTLLEPHLNLARLQVRSDDPAAAIATLSAALEHLPAALDPRVQLASLQLQQRQARRAVDTLEAGLAWHGTDPRYRFQLGQTLLAVGRTRSAEEQFTATLAAPIQVDGQIDGPNTVRLHVEAHLSLAQLAQRRGDTTAAHAQRAVAAKLLRARAQQLRQAGQVTEAEQLESRAENL